MILSLDGGGVRGIFAAHLLNQMQRILGINISETFDLIVGTSTGSIVAASVAANKDLSKLVDCYETSAQEIFKRRLCRIGLFKSKYDINRLKTFLYQFFGDIKLGNIDKPLILNATNVSTGSVHVFKSNYQGRLRNGDYVRDKEVLLYQAILASCSAPTYFDPVRIANDLVCDGSLWANNPVLVGYVDAVRNFKKDPGSIRIFSIGTGKANRFYSDSSSWGLLNGWQKNKIVDFAIGCQTLYAENCAHLVLDGNEYRINPEIDDWAIDNCKSIPILKRIAEQYVVNQGVQIRKFIED